MPYAKTKSHNGKDGWVTGTASGEGTFDNPVWIDKDIEPSDPSRVEEAPRIQEDGTVQIEKTGTNIPPSPNMAKQKLLDMAENNWGLTISQIRTLRNNYTLLFDFIEQNSYEKAKNEVTYVVSQEDFLDSTHEKNVHDLLDGAL